MTSSPAPDLDELERLREGATWVASMHAAVTLDQWWLNDQYGASLGLVEERALAEWIVAWSRVAPALLTELRAARAAQAESGRFREALTECQQVREPLWRDGYEQGRRAGAAIAAQWVAEGGDGPNRVGPDLQTRLATPPAPSDHGALPTRADLADTLCFVRRHRHTVEYRNCAPSRIEAERIIAALSALRAERATPDPPK